MVKKRIKSPKRIKSGSAVRGRRISGEMPNWIYVLILILISFGVYVNSLSGLFIADDYDRWLGAEWIKQKSFISIVKTIFTPHGGQYRPIPYTLHVMDYHLWGLNPKGFHLTNLILHIFSVVLVFTVALKILNGRIVSFMAAAFFSTHPMHTEAVSFIAARTDIIMGIFTLLAFLFYFKFRIHNGYKKGLYYVGYIIFFMMALMSKEAAVAIPLFLILFEIYFRPHREGLNRLVKLAYPLSPLIAITSIYLIVQAHTGATFLQEYQFNIWLQALTSVRTYCKYFGLLLFPIDPSATYNFPWSSSFYNPPSLFPMIVTIVYVFFTLWVFRANRIISFSLAWIFLSILPISNLIAFREIPVFAERYLYVPSVGFCFLLAVIVYKIYKKDVKTPKTRYLKIISILLSIIILAFYSIITIKRNPDWRSQHTIAARTLQQKPLKLSSGIAHGESFIKEGKYDDAIKHFKNAIKYNPKSLICHYYLALAYYYKGETEKAMVELNESIALYNKNVQGLYLLGMIYYEQKMFEKALEPLKKAVMLAPEYAPVHLLLSNIYNEINDREKAIFHYKKAMALDPDIRNAAPNNANK